MSSDPVVKGQVMAGLISTAIMTFLAMLVAIGVINLSEVQMGSIETFLGAFLALLVLLVPQFVAAFWSRGKVTPVASPRTAQGEPAALVPLVLMPEATKQMIAEHGMEMQDLQDQQKGLMGHP